MPPLRKRDLRMKLFDLHCDTLLRCYLENCGLCRNDGHLDLEKMERGGALAQCFAIFLPFEGLLRDGRRLRPYELFQDIHQLYEREMEQNAGRIAPTRTLQELKAHQAAGVISSVLTVEDGALLEGRLERVKELYEKGVRMLTLTWNYDNCIGSPNSAKPVEHAKGLKLFGFQVLEEMERLGMVVDVSHLSEGGFWDVARVSRKPFVASHSCARALCDHPRNLTDVQLRALADHGGVVGVNYNAEFLRCNSKRTCVDDILRHVEYMLQVAGSDAVALGSDFDGITCELELADYGETGKLVHVLERRYPHFLVEKICCQNALRVLQDCL